MTASTGPTFMSSCIECQKSVKSIPILPYNESWQAPLLRHFNLDSIAMPTGTGGVDRIIQATEPTILWTEARAVTGAGAAPVARFIYEDIICQFGCVPYFTFDGGPEFKKEVTELLETLYQCTVIFSTPYHPQGNAPVERAHQPLVDALFKCTGDAKGNWPKYLHAVLFAMRVTVSRATGFSPYYLLYSTHPIFSFDLTEITWQTLDWHMVHTHEELIALRALQLYRRDPKMREANDKLCETRRHAIERRGYGKAGRISMGLQRLRSRYVCVAKRICSQQNQRWEGNVDILRTLHYTQEART